MHALMKHADYKFGVEEAKKLLVELEKSQKLNSLNPSKIDEDILKYKTKNTKGKVLKK